MIRALIKEIKESRHREGIPVAISDLSPRRRGLLRRLVTPRNDFVVGFLLLALLGSMVIYAPKARAGLVVKLPSSLGLSTNLVGPGPLTSIRFMDTLDNLYDKWNDLKKHLARKTAVYCNDREIWWCSVGMNLGTELYGKNNLFERPVLVLKVYNRETALIVPLTSKVRAGLYYATVNLGKVTSSAILSQARVINTRRLSRKVGRISKSNFLKVKADYFASISSISSI